MTNVPATEPPEARELRNASAALDAATSACEDAYRAWMQAAREQATPRTRMALDEAERDVLLAWDKLRAARAALDPASVEEDEGPEPKSWSAH